MLLFSSSSDNIKPPFSEKICEEFIPPVPIVYPIPSQQPNIALIKFWFTQNLQLSVVVYKTKPCMYNCSGLGLGLGGIMAHYWLPETTIAVAFQLSILEGASKVAQSPSF